MIGNIDCKNDAEGRHIMEKRIPSYKKKDIEHDKDSFYKAISGFVTKFEHIHISFDIDVLDQSLLSATGTLSPNGFILSDLIAIYNAVRLAKIISLDLVEINPKKPGAVDTMVISQNVLQNFLS